MQIQMEVPDNGEPDSLYILLQVYLQIHLFWSLAIVFIIYPSREKNLQGTGNFITNIFHVTEGHQQCFIYF